MKVTQSALTALVLLSRSAVEARSGIRGVSANSRKLQELPLEVLGNDGKFDDFPLGLCQGECDTNADCAEGLYCFQREAGEPVPGCENFGPGFDSRGDFCVAIPSVLPDLDETAMPGDLMTAVPSGEDTFAESEALPVIVLSAEEAPPGDLAVVGQNGFPESAFPLGLCEGDCDNDDECAEGLVCLERDGGDEVPGCVGSLASITDYCVPAILVEMGDEEEEEEDKDDKDDKDDEEEEAVVAVMETGSPTGAPTMNMEETVVTMAPTSVETMSPTVAETMAETMDETMDETMMDSATEVPM